MKIKSMALTLCLLLMVLFNGVVYAESQTAASFSPLQKSEIKKIIHNYLLENPQILIEVSRKLQKVQEKIIQTRARKAIRNNAKKLFNDPNSPVAGNPQGKITIVEFYDYQCGHCKSATSTIKKLLSNNPDVRLIYKPWPIFGKNSQLAAKAALAATKQSKYVAFHQNLMSVKKELKPKVIFKLAKKAGLNLKQLKTDMKASAIENEIKQNFELANDIGIRGTPTFIVAKYDVTKEELAPEQQSLINKNKKSSVYFIPGAVNEAYLQNVINKIKS